MNGEKEENIYDCFNLKMKKRGKLRTRKKIGKAKN